MTDLALAQVHKQNTWNIHAFYTLYLFFHTGDTAHELRDLCWHILVTLSLSRFVYVNGLVHVFCKSKHYMT